MLYPKATPSSYAAGLLNALKQNRISIKEGQLRKQRRWWSRISICVSNLFLKFSNGHIFVLSSNAAWQRWELHSYQLLYEIEGQPIGNREICIPAFQGRSLREHNARHTLTPSMIVAAAAEFRRVHGLLSPLTGRHWTHGDPHIGNVLYDERTGCAYLIDFETQHESERSEIDCKADDLLVFILELMGTSSDWVELSRLFLRTYAHRDVLQRLEQRLHFQSGLERLLWKIRTNSLPLSFLQLRIEQLGGVLSHMNQDSTWA